MVSAMDIVEQRCWVSQSREDTFRQRWKKSQKPRLRKGITFKSFAFSPLSFITISRINSRPALSDNKNSLSLQARKDEHSTCSRL